MVEDESSSDNPGPERSVEEVQESPDRVYYTKAYRRAHEDAQRALDAHLDVFNEIAEKGGRISRFSGAIIAILAAVGTSSNVSPFLNLLTLSGIGALVISSVLGLYGQSSQETRIGTGRPTFEALEKYEMKELDYLRYVVVDQYPDWIDEAAKNAEKKNRVVEWANYLSIGGIMLILAGILFTIYT